MTDSEQEDFGAPREPARPTASEMHFLRKLARRLPARSNLQPTAKSFLNNQTLDPLPIDPIVRALDMSLHASLNERMFAAAIAPYIPFEPQQRRMVSRSLIGVLDSESEQDSALLCAFWIFSFFPFVTPIAPIVQQGRVNRLRTLAARALGRMHHISAIDALARALWDAAGPARTLGRESVRRESANSLLSLLPLLTGRHRTLLDLDTVPNLARALRSSQEPLVLAILESFHHIAGGEAVRAVEIAARKGASGRIRAAAASLLPILMERREAERAPSTLLRAAASGDLLRPVKDDPARWLRPADRAA